MAKITISIKPKDALRIKSMLESRMAMTPIESHPDLSTEAKVVRYYGDKIKQTLIQELKIFEREKIRREKESEIVIDEVNFDE